MRCDFCHKETPATVSSFMSFPKSPTICCPECAGHVSLPTPPEKWIHPAWMGSSPSLLDTIRKVGKENDDLRFARNELLLQVEALTGELALARKVIQDQEARIEAEKLDSDRLAEINKVFQVEVETLRQRSALYEMRYINVFDRIERLRKELREAHDAQKPGAVTSEAIRPATINWNGLTLHANPEKEPAAEAPSPTVRVVDVPPGDADYSGPWWNVIPGIKPDARDSLFLTRDFGIFLDVEGRFCITRKLRNAIREAVLGREG